MIELRKKHISELNTSFGLNKEKENTKIDRINQEYNKMKKETSEKVKNKIVEQSKKIGELLLRNNDKE